MTHEPMPGEQRTMARKWMAVSISILVFCSFATIAWIAASGRTTAHELEIETQRAKEFDAQRGRDICVAVNRKLLIPLGNAARAQVGPSLATFQTLIDSAPTPEQRAAFEETREEYLVGVQQRSALYDPLNCNEPLGPQLPAG